MNNTVKINKGPGGFGGPLTIKVNGDKNKLVYITEDINQKLSIKLPK